jgi:hypothetical protein
MELKDFVAGVRRGDEAVRELYLHDWSLSRHCPWLARELVMPKYFAQDRLQRLLTEAADDTTLGYRDDWPSLFIGSSDTRSGLHVDSFESHFWMLMLQGSKRWVFVDPSQRPFLYEDRESSSFDSDILSPDFTAHPLLRAANASEVTRFWGCKWGASAVALTKIRAMNPREQVILTPGELLIVPAGTPHQVQNLEDTVAIAGNFVDSWNVERVLRSLRVASQAGHAPSEMLSHAFRRTKGAAAAAAADGPETLERDLPWSEFKRGRAALLDRAVAP